MKQNIYLCRVAIDERLFGKIEEYYKNTEDDTLVNYTKFCDDLDIVFNLPVYFNQYRIEKKSRL